MLNKFWFEGFHAGAKQQRTQDIKLFGRIIDSLDVKGVGPKTKQKIIDEINRQINEGGTKGD